jgi:hypothetical protein
MKSERNKLDGVCHGSFFCYAEPEQVESYRGSTELAFPGYPFSDPGFLMTFGNIFGFLEGLGASQGT